VIVSVGAGRLETVIVDEAENLVSSSPSKPLTLKVLDPTGVLAEVLMVRVDVAEVGVFPVKETVLGLNVALAPVGKVPKMLRAISRFPLPVLFTVTV
jgi:hypothetical protein